MEGYIYCLTNEAIPNLVKIGKTARDPVQRAAEISANTGVPTPFAVAWSLKVADMDRAETDLHAALHNSRLQKRREFFRCSPAKAKAAARRLSSVKAPKAQQRSAGPGDTLMGLVLTAGTLATFYAAITLDLDTVTIAKAVAALAIGLGMIFQGRALLGMLRR